MDFGDSVVSLQRGLAGGGAAAMTEVALLLQLVLMLREKRGCMGIWDGRWVAWRPHVIAK